MYTLSNMRSSVLYITGVLLLVTTVSSATEPKDGDVMLKYSSVSIYEGIVHVYRKGRWGGICSTTFNIDAANTVCRQLGYAMATRAENADDAFPDHPNEVVVIDHLYCSGNEKSLMTDCTISWSDENNDDHYDKVQDYCSDEDVAAIACSPIKDYAVRLKGGASWYEGRVEVYHESGGHNHWGTICNDYWSNTDARVICRQLKYGNPEKGREKDGDLYKPGSAGMQVLLDNVYCSGSEETLAGCTSNGWHNENCLLNTELAGVFCEPAGQTGNLTTGAIAGIILGSILGVIVLVSVVAVCYSQSRSKKQGRRATAIQATETSSGGVTYFSSSGTNAGAAVAFVNPPAQGQPQQPMQYIMPANAPTSFMPPSLPPPLYTPTDSGAVGGTAIGGAFDQDAGPIEKKH